MCLHGSLTSDHFRVYFLDLPEDSVKERLALRRTDPITGEKWVPHRYSLVEIFHECSKNEFVYKLIL